MHRNRSEDPYWHECYVVWLQLYNSDGYCMKMVNLWQNTSAIWFARPCNYMGRKSAYSWGIELNNSTNLDFNNLFD